MQKYVTKVYCIQRVCYALRYPHEVCVLAPMMHDCPTAYSEGGVEDVIEVGGQEVEKALAAGRRHGVAGMVHVRPGIGPLR